MPRALDPAFATALQSGYILPFFALQLTFVSGTYYLCSLPCSITFGNQTYTGTGTLGKLSGIRESIDLEATGTTVSLSGVDNSILQQCLEDIQLGAPATIYFGALDPTTAQVIGTPSVYFAGLIDQPTLQSSVTESTISLRIESRLLRLQSGGQKRRYTTADQRLFYPDDTGFDQVEQLSDRALKFGY